MLATTMSRDTRTNLGLCALLVAFVSVGGCFRDSDPSKVKCADDRNCPGGYACSKQLGTCVASSQLPLDASVAGTGGTGGSSTKPAGGADGGLSGGAGGSSTKPVGGADGGLAGAAGGALGGSDVGGSVADANADFPAASPIGSACQVDGDCAKAHCVDGICCESLCGGCNACSNALTGKADGTCAPVASGQDPHDACADETATNQCGNDGTCDGAGACRKVGGNHVCAAGSCSADGKTYTATTTCDGKGACTVATPQSCGVYQCTDTGCAKACDPSAANSCDKGNYCNATTKTCAAQKPDGQPATQATECTSGILADGVCCHEACTGCNACTAALNGQAATTTGQCLPVKAGYDDPHKTCTAAPPCGLDGKCDGAGACRYISAGTACAADSCTGSTLSKSACDSAHACTATKSACPNSSICASASACKSGCTSNADCASGSFCSSGACKPKVDDGAVCAADGDCVNGHCISGICCNVGTCGACNSCSTGTCKPVVNGTACGTGNFCNDGTCGACPDGSTCSPDGNPCKTGKVSCATGTAVCQNLVNVANGTPTVCGTGKVCKNGACNACVEGASCTGDTTDQCHSYAISCATGDGVCKVSGNKANTTPCGPAQSCTGGIEYDQAKCSDGTCPAQTTKTCPSTGCNGTSCAAACTASQTACGTSCCTTSTQYCNGTTCATKLQLGVACTDSSRCASGHCCSKCVDWSNDSNNCGACGKLCPMNNSCSSSLCSCIGTELSCRCGGWNFEGTYYDSDGWDIGSWRGATAAATYAGVVDFQGTKALRVDIVSGDAGNAVGGVSTLLCEGGVAVSGWTLSLRVWFAPSDSSQPAMANGMLSVVDALGGTMGNYTGSFATGRWLTVDVPLSPSGPTDALGIQLAPYDATNTSHWSGSMYLDDIRLH